MFLFMVFFVKRTLSSSKTGQQVLDNVPETRSKHIHVQKQGLLQTHS